MKRLAAALMYGVTMATSVSLYGMFARPVQSAALMVKGVRALSQAGISCPDKQVTVPVKEHKLKLKTGAYLPRKMVIGTTRELINLATHPGPHAAPELVHIVKASFGKIKFNGDRSVFLHNFAFVDRKGNLLDSAIEIVRSAVRFDPEIPELSIMGSPRVGFYSKRPLTLHSAEFNACSAIDSLTFNERGNVIEVWFGKWPFQQPRIKTDLLCYEDEQEPDDIEYLPEDFIHNRVRQYYDQEFDYLWHINLNRTGDGLGYFFPDQEALIRKSLESKNR